MLKSVLSINFQIRQAVSSQSECLFPLFYFISVMIFDAALYCYIKFFSSDFMVVNNNSRKPVFESSVHFIMSQKTMLLLLG